MSKTEMYRFETENFIVRATIQPDDDLDLSWDVDGETRAKLKSGKFKVFGTIVTVSTRDGIVLGGDSLWALVYDDPRKFFTNHRDPDPMNRNCSLMRAARGHVSIRHHFPYMVSQAIKKARRTLATMPKVPAPPQDRNGAMVPSQRHAVPDEIRNR
jgi:hypothetical protein